MKTFKYFLLVLLILIIGFFTYVAVQPNAYNIKRTKLINAPSNVIYNNINDLKQWENWGPWHDADSTIVTTYSKNTIGIGATSNWTSKDGPGNMKIVNTIPNKTIDLKLQFGDYEPTDIIWTLEEVEGGTSVTWAMKNDNNPFMFKIFGALSGGMDNMLGPMEEQGLKNLAKVVDEQIKNMPKAFKLGDIEEVTLTAQTFIGYLQKTSTEMSHEEMSKLFMEFMPKAGMYIADKLAPDAYIPGTFYTKWDEETKEAEFYIGLLLKKEVAPAEGMTKLEIPEGKALKIAKFGNYGTGDYEAHTAIGTYMQDKKIEMNGASVWELYVNDPTTVETEDIQTDIYYPIK
ncbi:GyrI-like domain-containing protein [Lacinutrix sp. C3R15]|uniref:GyrI-like domain-containing protein n=1 Tax=Flavobacteriaceae TaxID=49546 RepID=UPI001C082ABC|nr:MULTISPECIES: GyrI-like domain-containing protein [Flavobacteriaceae]MBU2940250.1 GyrI-like domain-containing protein [Lacinutrix sp. C3R15]MDO6623569.1 GyrI-like domain-containing protein [Oceanihabitans sp. 1_MG-2023]